MDVESDVKRGNGAEPQSDDATTGDSADDQPEQPPLGSRAPHFIQRYRPLHISWQVGVFLVGLAIVLAGVVMLAFPGPGWLTIFAGMAVWATEFVWAQLAMRWTKRRVARGTSWLKEARARRRARKQSR